jgi:hypothetical protein
MENNRTYGKTGRFIPREEEGDGKVGTFHGTPPSIYEEQEQEQEEEEEEEDTYSRTGFIVLWFPSVYIYLERTFTNL